MMIARHPAGWRRWLEELAIGPNPINKNNLVIHGFTVGAILVVIASLFSPGWTTSMQLCCTVAGISMWIASIRASRDYGLAILCMILAGVLYVYAQLTSGDKSPYLGLVYLKGALVSAAFPGKEDFEKIISKRAERHTHVPNTSQANGVILGEGHRLTIFFIAAFSLLLSYVYGLVEEKKDRSMYDEWIDSPTGIGK